MSISLIQSKVTLNSVGAGTMICTFDAPTTAGSTIVACATGTTNGTAPSIDTVTDDHSNVYRKISRSHRGPTVISGYTDIFTQFAWVKHATAGTEAVTMVLTAGAAYFLSIYELEESECRLFLNGNGTGGTTAPSLGPVTPGTADSLTIASFTVDNNLGSTTPATAGTGWTAVLNNGGGNAGGFTEYRALTSAAAITADGTFSIGGPTLEWAGSLASFTTILPVPVNTVPAVVAGLASVGETLTATPGTWTSEVSRVAQWQRSLTTDFDADGEDIDGETSTTYVIQSGDLAYYIRYLETSTNASGFETRESNTVGTVGTSVGDLVFLFELQTDMSVEIPTGLVVPDVPSGNMTAAFVVLISYPRW